ncbi:MAG: MauE/DoxX family redox-associated membrane protein [Jatrophihabitantaceae bacterium]
MIGLVSAAALLLAAAGLAKLGQRAPVRSALAAAGIPGAHRLGAKAANRLSGAVELAVALLALLVGGRAGAALIAVAFGVLAGLSARMMSIESGQDCGCFAKPVAVSHWHTAVNLSCALAGLIALVQPAGSLISQFAERPGTAAALLLAAVVLAYLGYLVMTALPELTAATAELEAAG